MQHVDRISLNALRVFAAVAECGSMKLAAARLGVTAGAVSHQVRGLEDALGVRLLHRLNNSIRLTDAGDNLFRQVHPAIRNLQQALETTLSGLADISVQVPVTLATRWLIPRLDAFRARHPDLRIRIETTSVNGMPPHSGADIVLAYFPMWTAPPDAEVLLEDLSRPHLSPALLRRAGTKPRLDEIPALQCAGGNWDWQNWLRESGHTEATLRWSGHFDLDDAALRAAVAGLGMVLAPRFIIADDLEAGTLCPIPETEEVRLGAYVLFRKAPQTRWGDRFVEWLRNLASN
ncbi:MAG: LysR family transcriptional regulator [Pararhodobacter sp.]|nr:LysR family transcriptional regulator [Pararhodobacter sp.]